MLKNDILEIVIVDDHPIMRYGISSYLKESGFSVSGEVDCINDIFQYIDMNTTSCCLNKNYIVFLDISLRDDDDLEQINKLHTQDAHILVYSLHEDRETITKAFRIGAKGYVTKRDVPPVLLEAISKVMVGEKYISPIAAQAMVSTAMLTGHELYQKISQREMEVLHMLGQGDGRATIAEALSINTRTVDTYCSRIISKLGIRSMKELKKFAINLRW